MGTAVFALLTTIIPLIPKWIEAGQVTFGIYKQIRNLIDEDRSMTADERAQLETMIARDEAAVNDTLRDV